MTTAWLDVMGGAFCHNYYKAGNINTRCLEAGHGEPLVLLHGAGGYAEAYLKNLIPLSEYFHVYAIDMIGHGYTDAPDIEYTIPLFVEHLKNFLDAASLERAHISGESWGGWVAAWLAIKHPDRVKKLVLNTSAGFHDPNVPGLSQLKARSEEAASSPSRENVKKRLEWLFHKPEDITDEMVEVRLQIYNRPGVLRATKRMLDWAFSDACDPERLTPENVRKIKAETLILWTSQNPGMSWQVAEEQLHRHLAGSQFLVMEECGHWPQWEQPQEFNKVFIDFFSDR